jgi:hypothetical protein
MIKKLDALCALGVHSLQKENKMHEEISLDLDPDPRRSSALYPVEYVSPGGESV